MRACMYSRFKGQAVYVCAPPRSIKKRMCEAQVSRPSTKVVGAVPHTLLCARHAELEEDSEESEVSEEAEAGSERGVTEHGEASGSGAGLPEHRGGARKRRAERAAERLRDYEKYHDVRVYMLAIYVCSRACVCV